MEAHIGFRGFGCRVNRFSFAGSLLDAGRARRRPVVEMVVQQRLGKMAGTSYMVAQNTNFGNPKPLNPSTLNPNPDTLKTFSRNPQASADGSTRRGWMTKAGVLLHKWRRGYDLEPDLRRLSEHHAMVPFLSLLDRQYDSEGPRCYKRWL